MAPVLYVLHAILAASCQFVANTLDMHMGFTFSQGGIDFLMFNLIGGKAKNAWYVFLLYTLCAGVYYLVFSVVITKMDLKTPGREKRQPRPARPRPKAFTVRPWIWSGLSAAGATSLALIPASPAVCGLRWAIRPRSIRRGSRPWARPG